MAIGAQLASRSSAGRPTRPGGTSPSSRPRRPTTASTPSAWPCSCPAALDTGLGADDLRPLVDGIGRWGGGGVRRGRALAAPVRPTSPWPRATPTGRSTLFEQVFADREVERLVWSDRGHRPRRRRPGAARPGPARRRRRPRRRGRPPAGSWEGWRVEALGARAPARPAGCGADRRAGRAHPAGAGGRWPWWPRGSPTPSWPTGSTSRPDGRRPRLEHPRQAGHVEPHRGGGVGVRSGSGSRPASRPPNGEFTKPAPRTGVV